MAISNNHRSYNEKGLQVKNKRFLTEKGMIVVKKYRDRYKLTLHKSLRLKGYEEIDLRDRTILYGKSENLYDKDPEYKNIEVYVDDLTGIEYYAYDTAEKKIEKEYNPEKLANNISRARSTIYELAMCNDWDYFCTFTLDKNKYDRYDLKKFHKDFTQKIRDLNKKYSTHINFILIPEKHKNGAWHMHGLLSGLPDQELRAFTNKEHLPLYILEKVISGSKIFSWITYEKKFGFNDIEPIKDIYKVSRYITKYITKSLSESVKESYAQLYYCSRGLKRAKEVVRGFIDNPDDDGLEFDFVNDYLKIKWMDENEFKFIEDFIDKK